MQAHLEPAVALLLEQLVGAVIPDLHRPRAVLAAGDLAGERGVGERMILDVNREGASTGIERDALRHRPRGERAIALEPEVVVEATRVVTLDDEDRLGARRAALERLRRRAGRALAAIAVELIGHGIHLQV